MSNVEMVPVKSSLVESVGYDADQGSLCVKFKGGATYCYSGVSQETYDAMMAAKSIGIYFVRYIKANFDCTKQDGPK